MCLAIPGRITDISDELGMRMGTVDFDGLTKQVCLAYVPEAEPGDYVLVHVGFALARVDAAQAQRTLDLLAELGALGDGDTAEDAEQR